MDANDPNSARSPLLFDMDGQRTEAHTSARRREIAIAECWYGATIFGFAAGIIGFSAARRGS
jgi:hypothetical protein